jgi:hypothetical protein
MMKLIMHLGEVAVLGALTVTVIAYIDVLQPHPLVLIAAALLSVAIMGALPPRWLR